MRIWLPLGLCIAGAVTVATVVFAGERLAFEAQALLMRPTASQGPDATPKSPEVTIECDKPDCKTGATYYEVVADGTGRPRAIRFDGAILPDSTGRLRLTRFKVEVPFRKPSIYTRAPRPLSPPGGRRLSPAGCSGPFNGSASFRPSVYRPVTCPSPIQKVSRSASLWSASALTILTAHTS